MVLAPPLHMISLRNMTGTAYGSENHEHRTFHDSMEITAAGKRDRNGRGRFVQRVNGETPNKQDLESLGQDWLDGPGPCGTQKEIN